MAAEQRKLLEQLMGDSLMGMGASQPKVKITDPKVCRSYLAGQCPHDLFSNTKSDLGTCPKIHSEALKTEYESASQEQKDEWKFSYDLMRDYGRFVEECNRKIDIAARRLEKTETEIRQTNMLLKRAADLGANVDCGVEELEVMLKFGAKETEYEEVMVEIEDDEAENDASTDEVHANGDTNGESKPRKKRTVTRLRPKPPTIDDEGFPAARGLVNLALMEHVKLRALLQRKAETERELKTLSDTGGPSGHQKLQVCDVCGAYLSRLDNDRRLADHFYGKMHLGYAQMRKTYDRLSKEWKEKGVPAGRMREYDVSGVPNSGGGGGFDGGDGYGGGYGGRGGGYGGYGGGGRGWGGGGGGGGGRGGRGRGRGRRGY